MNETELQDSTTVYALTQEHEAGVYLQVLVDVCSVDHDGEGVHYHTFTIQECVYGTLDDAINAANLTAYTSHTQAGFSHPRRVDLNEN